MGELIGAGSIKDVSPARKGLTLKDFYSLLRQQEVKTTYAFQHGDQYGASEMLITTVTLPDGRVFEMTSSVCNGELGFFLSRPEVHEIKLLKINSTPNQMGNSH
jgi:hypothetical protein